MKVEVLVYVYCAICIGMIGFNIFSILLNRSRNRLMTRVSKGFDDRIVDELSRLSSQDRIHEGHKRYLSKKLKRVANMRAFDAALERKYKEDPESVQQYLASLGGVFVCLAVRYCKKDAIEAAYFPYILKKYRILRDRPFDAMIDMLYHLLKQPSIYCRENAMQAIYTIGDPVYVVKALELIDRNDRFYHTKLLTDGLLRFDGNTKRLDLMLWDQLERFSVPMQVTLLNYFRFSSGRYCDRMLRLLEEPEQQDEIKFACIRYLGKYPAPEAHPVLLSYADSQNSDRWEYAAIASVALASYPSVQTTALLEKNLHHSNWYIRYNAAQSLDKLGLSYTELIDVIEGGDRYASEIIRYRFDMRSVIEEEKKEAAVC